tara:strand:+ start:377 stop:577 length:201 start_codon:yes stop_codon:yes gene_type:complete
MGLSLAFNILAVVSASTSVVIMVGAPLYAVSLAFVSGVIVGLSDRYAVMIESTPPGVESKEIRKTL